MTSTNNLTTRRETYRAVSDALGLHNVCPMAACKRHKCCLQAEPDANMLRRLGTSMADRVRSGMTPCMALLAEGVHAGIPEVGAIVAEMQAREAELRAQMLAQQS